ncbi:MAG TPA: protoglobin domain-containing protein [Polyangiaceae bacterium]|jgi:rsbT co-antagonist protein RsbR
MEPARHATEQTLMRELGLDTQNIDRRKRHFTFGPDDVVKLVALRPIVAAHAAELVDVFFDQLVAIDEAKTLLSNHELTDRARTMKREHLLAMVGGTYDASYVEQRLRLGLLYARAGLDTRVFLGAFQALVRSVGVRVMREGGAEAFDRFTSFEKLAFFDVSIILDVLVYERERTIRQQQEAIRELSTPVLQLRNRLLLLPIIGVIDTHRAQLITDGLLRSIRANRARVAVMDVTGVATIDSKVAHHLLQTVSAARLMGAHVIVTGLSSDVAQSLVAIGLDVGRFNTVGDLQGGLEEAERILGFEIVQRQGDHGVRVG